MKIIVFALLFAFAYGERLQVVTPENVSLDNITETDDDTYIKAYKELHTTAERRTPDDYNTLSHSSYVEDDIYPEINYKGYPYKQKYQIYGPPAPVSYYHHHLHHHPESVVHHNEIGFAEHLHLLSHYFHKFGVHAILKLITKIIVLKLLMKFVVVIALFFVLPSFMQKDKDKDEDRLISDLNSITDRVWNSIMENESMEDDDSDEDDEESGNHENHEDDEHGMEEDGHKKPKKEELDELDMKLIKKLIREWKEEHFGGPDKGSAVSFLEKCVNFVNRILGAVMGYVKMKNGNMDVFDGMMFDKMSVYAKHVAHLWPKIQSYWKFG